MGSLNRLKLKLLIEIFKGEIHMKLKLIVAAVAFAAAGQASAAIVLSPTGNGELFLSAYDAAANKSYTRDLGITIDQFLAAGTTAPVSGSTYAFNPSATPATAPGNVVTPGYKLTFGADSLLQSFMGATGSGTLNSGIIWNIGAADSSGVNRYLTTTNAPASTPSSLTGGQLRTFANVDGYLGGANALGTNFTGTNGSNTATPADGTAYFTTFGNNWLGSANFDSTASVGQNLNFLMLSTVGTKSTTPIAVTEYKNVNGNAMWNLASDGTLTYSAPAAVSAVPVPAAVWLLGSGLIGMVGVARRRKVA